LGEPGPDVFLSYAREDEARALELATALDQRGFSVFWDREVPPGKTWHTHIGQALVNARCVVVAWSRHSIVSDWVIEEANEGKRRKILVPVLFEAVQPPFGFGGIQAASLVDWRPARPSPAFDRLLGAIQRIVGGRAGSGIGAEAERSTPPQPAPSEPEPKIQPSVRPAPPPASRERGAEPVSPPNAQANRWSGRRMVAMVVGLFATDGGPVTIANAGLALALAAGLALLLAGPGHRFGWWSLGTGFAIIRYAAYGGIAAAAVSAAAIILAPLRGQRRGMFRALAGLAIGLITVGVPAYYLYTARSVPPIHDISTDTEDPPAFEAVLPLRAEAPNPANYGGPAVAAQQQDAYADIAPADYPIAPEAAFEAALAAARDMGWTIVAADEGAGRIEASDQTFWFGFVDDIVIRVRPTDAGSRIDVRSVSRVGVSDTGTNAARVRAYLAQLENEIGGAP
jgi:uncharacterized protein (DUF1499 family)